MVRTTILLCYELKDNLITLEYQAYFAHILFFFAYCNSPFCIERDQKNSKLLKHLEPLCWTWVGLSVFILYRGPKTRHSIWTRLTSAEQQEIIPSTQWPSILSTSSVAREGCWLLFSMLPTETSRAFSAEPSLSFCHSWFLLKCSLSLVNLSSCPCWSFPQACLLPSE